MGFILLFFLGFQAVFSGRWPPQVCGESQILLQPVNYLETFPSFPSELCLLLFLISSVHCGHRRGPYGAHSQLSVGTTGVRDAPGSGGLGAGACCSTGSSARRAGCVPCTQSQRPRLSFPVADVYPGLGPTSPLPAFLCHCELDVILTHHTPEGNQITVFFCC